MAKKINDEENFSMAEEQVKAYEGKEEIEVNLNTFIHLKSLPSWAKTRLEHYLALNPKAKTENTVEQWEKILAKL
ncbi:MAG: hypothetical protein M0P61_00410 [Ignavibacteriaceae bacterium]|jgi:hypothetical protein|nr:hypothetical protein [Ignavibacteriaceae bacterium]